MEGGKERGRKGGREGGMDGKRREERKVERGKGGRGRKGECKVGGVGRGI